MLRAWSASRPDTRACTAASASAASRRAPSAASCAACAPRSSRSGCSVAAAASSARDAAAARSPSSAAASASARCSSDSFSATWPCRAASSRWKPCTSLRSRSSSGRWGWWQWQQQVAAPHRMTPHNTAAAPARLTVCCGRNSLLGAARPAEAGPADRGPDRRPAPAAAAVQPRCTAANSTTQGAELEQALQLRQLRVQLQHLGLPLGQRLVTLLQLHLLHVRQTHTQHHQQWTKLPAALCPQRPWCTCAPPHTPPGAP